MKKLFITASISLFVLTSFNMPKMEPVEYNDAIINEQTKISKVMLDMAGAFGTDINKAEIYRKVLVKQCELSIETTKKLPPYDGSTKFRDAGVALYSFYKAISEKEYKEMIDILKKGSEITEDDITTLTNLEKQIGEKEIALDDAFQLAQVEFAKKYNLQLEENKMQDDIDNLAK
jgi:hypothetical protein